MRGFGRYIACDNCGNKVFQGMLDENHYEDSPAYEAFRIVGVMNRSFDLCPTCTSEYKRIMIEYLPSLIMQCQEEENNEMG